MSQLPVRVVTPALDVPLSRAGASVGAPGPLVYLDDVCGFAGNRLTAAARGVDWCCAPVHHDLLRRVLPASVDVPLSPAANFGVPIRVVVV